METKSCWDPKCMAPAIIRWAMGTLFLVGGIAKLGNLTGFVTGYLVPAFAKTILPEGLVAVYGYALPFVEVILGGMLILGFFRNLALFVSGLTLISLAFGQILLQQHATVANIFVYILMVSAALFMSAQDCWTVCRCFACGEKKESCDANSPA